MDSLTHIVVGAAIGTAVLGRKAGARAAMWGAVCGTLPDLDVLLPYGDPVRDFTFHRGSSHSLFWLTLAAPVLAGLVARLSRATGANYREWLLATWLALLAHPLLDACTVYGTQLLLPFSDHPVGLGSIFIIDPLYTLPLVIGLVAALRLGPRDPVRARRWNAAGLAASTLYLGWTVAAQAHVLGVVQHTLATTPLAAGRVLATPAPFTSLLWRVVVMDPRGYHEGYYSLLDDGPPVRLEKHASDPALLDPLRDEWAVQRLGWFTKGFYSAREASPGLRVAGGSVSSLRQLLGLVETAAAQDAAGSIAGSPIVMTDLRMGQTPWFVFAFVVGARDGEQFVPVPVQQVPSERPPLTALSLLWRRIWDETIDLDEVTLSARR